MSYAKTILSGRIGQIETKEAGGSNLVEFSLAVDDGFGDKKTTVWYKITAWKKLADTINQYCGVGKRILVEGGNVKSRGYAKKDGTVGVSQELTVYNVSIIDFKDKEESVTTDSIPF